MRIKITSVFVDDLEKALTFYTEVLGFQKKMDTTAGAARWITVVSPEEPDGVELLLEPNDSEAAQTYQQAIYEQGVPMTSFVVDDLQDEYTRLADQGVVFFAEPTEAGPVTFAVFDDTCGNLIQLSQAR
ncbi:VOC family protein [Barrientosiimonas marina]|uniref:VOC family protein n=1 Tax=Lentibacillus kimchii TaxID=1542911 RepID=A0ABW2UUR2_9BACI